MGQFSTFLEATALAPCIGFCIITNYKLGSLLLQSDTLTNFITVMNEMFPKNEHQIKEYKALQYTSNTINFEKMYVFSMLTVIWIFNLSGVAQTVIEYNFLNMPLIRRYAYFLWYPFDIDEDLKYSLVYIQQMHAGLIAAWGTLASDILMISMINLCVMQFDYISNTITNYLPSRNPNDTGMIKKIVIHHQKVLKLSEDVNEIFSMAILFNFLASSVIICLVGFQTTAGVSALELFKYMLFLIFELVQVWTICYLGQKLIDSSSGVAEAAFNQKWFEGNVQHQKSILLIMTRAQKPAIINAKSFTVVSLESFTKVCSISYQFFALLRTVYNK
ncbi:putative odorant receptor 92a [Condylostylus longicornis]|uniref:putative odorant receptor 92a n=1 Tax=Condylostylus longicornis TaxID=2530218 RepID=UPI00244E1B53|nr:putative odorant receptor 92a [Condylostylus longicornis]